MTEEKTTSSSVQEKPEKKEVQEEIKVTEQVASPAEENLKKDKKEEKSEEKINEEDKKNKTELKDYSYLKPGMTVRVHQQIKEAGKKKGETKTRIQIFEGMILAIKNHGIGKTITVRKISNGIGVEKIFPIYLPTIIDIEPIKQARVKRSKLYYLRTHKKRLKERRITRESK